MFGERTWKKEPVPSSEINQFNLIVSLSYLLTLPFVSGVRCKHIVDRADYFVHALWGGEKYHSCQFLANFLMQILCSVLHYRKESYLAHPDDGDKVKNGYADLRGTGSGFLIN